MSRRFTVGVIGCGLMGMRRATTAAAHPACAVTHVYDVDPAAARRVAEACGATAIDDWRRLVEGVNVVVVSTPNAFLEPVTVAALGAGRHVLAEKPMGRCLAEAERMATAARDVVLKIGFNHRYHPAVSEALRAFREGAIGSLLNMRARYGHGGRPGYEREWRGDPELAGGGELTDQGVHVVDLLQAFAGPATHAVAFLQTAAWPVAPLEDNAFALLRFGDVVAGLHTSWTQWRNLFSLEIFGEKGALVVEGLGGSYGPETLAVQLRRPEGGAPRIGQEAFPPEDASWRLEWEDFLQAVDGCGPLAAGTPAESLAVMRTLDALYRSASTGQVVAL